MKEEKENQESAADARLKGILQDVSKQILTAAQSSAIEADMKQDLANFRVQNNSTRTYFYSTYGKQPTTSQEKKIDTAKS